MRHILDNLFQIISLCKLNSSYLHLLFFPVTPTFHIFGLLSSVLAVTWHSRQREGHCNVLLTSACAQYDVSRLQQHSRPASLPRLLRAVAYQLTQAVASRWAERGGWASPGAPQVLSRLLARGVCTHSLLGAALPAPGASQLLEKSKRAGNECVTATTGVNLCWADEVKTPAPLHTLPQQCMEQWPAFLFSRQVKVVGWRYL